ncbi:multiheme c-type cytochrome [Thermopirellula anaerolimosa]
MIRRFSGQGVNYGWLGVVFLVVAGLFAFLAGNSVYLLGITLLEWSTGESLQNFFYQFAFLFHLAAGLLLLVPLAVFMFVHNRRGRKSRNTLAVRFGYASAILCILVIVSGLLLWRPAVLVIRGPEVRTVVHWAHVIGSAALLGGYWLHRRAGRRSGRRGHYAWAGASLGFLLLFVLAHSFDPRGWRVVRPQEGEAFFEPSLARTASGGFIRADVLMDDRYCRDCHGDVHRQWSESAHRFSSFNNPVYLAAVRETRQFSMEREGSPRRARWCAGCHDPVPFFSGLFDDPNYDDVSHPTAHAGLTCTACHGIVEINSVRGNGDYVIEEPLHYPFAFSDDPVLKWVNHQLIRAKPEFHKRTFLKPFHKTAEFCSVCHKVHIPEALNDYKFLRGQNHYDSFLLSGVSGHGARSFYYPPAAKENCAECHMPPEPSADFGAKHYEGLSGLAVRDHLFRGANTALPFFRRREDIVRTHQEFLRGCLRVDIFGLRRGDAIDGELLAPLRPRVPRLVAGETYLLEVVVRTLTVGHHFTQGTTDSNEVWLHLRVDDSEGTLLESGGIDEDGRVDPAAHFVNVFMLDRQGYRIARRNPQDIFIPLYDNQIPPGAAATVHYRLPLPEQWAGRTLTVRAEVLYRKFDADLMEFVTGQMKPGEPLLPGQEPGQTYRNNLPITVLAEDSLEMTVVAPDADPHVWEDSGGVSTVEEWERWNDYGIGLFLRGKTQLRQAAEAFRRVEALGRFDGAINLGRTYFAEGNLDQAVAALRRAVESQEPDFPWWTAAWLSAQIDRQQGNLEAAAESLRKVLAPPDAYLRSRGFDFRRDYEVINLLGETLFDMAKRLRSSRRQNERTALLREAADWFQRTLTLDPENVTAHYNLSLIYAYLGDAETSQRHRELHAKYRVDDNARDRAVAAARSRYPEADRAAEAVVIYPLHNVGGVKVSDAAGQQSAAFSALNEN